MSAANVGLKAPRSCANPTSGPAAGACTSAGAVRPEGRLASRGFLPGCAVTSAPAACSHSRSRAAQTKEVPEGSAQSAPAPQTGKRAALLRKVKTFGGSAKQNVYDLTGARLLCLAAAHGQRA